MYHTKSYSTLRRFKSTPLNPFCPRWVALIVANNPPATKWLTPPPAK